MRKHRTQLVAVVAILILALGPAVSAAGTTPPSSVNLLSVVVDYLLDLLSFGDEPEGEAAQTDDDGDEFGGMVVPTG